MTIRRMTKDDAPSAAALWLAIFGDSEPFTDWYFSERFCPEYSFAAFDGDRMIAMTLGRATDICVEGTIRRALLISGVSTVPEYRGKGLMHAIVGKQIGLARESGFSCCYLHPVAESLYVSLGFRNGTDALLIKSDANRTHAPYRITETNDLVAMQTVYDALVCTHDGMQIRDENEFRTLLRDYATDGGRTLIAYKEDRPVGYLEWLDDGTVSELFALYASAYEALLDHAANDAGKELKAIVPTDCGVCGERVYSMQYLVFDDAFRLPLKNGFCRVSY